MIDKLNSMVDSIFNVVEWITLLAMGLGIMLLMFVVVSMIYAGIDIYFLQST